LLRQVDKPEEIARAIATVLAEGTYWCADSRLALLPAFKDRPVLQPDKQVSEREAEVLWLYLDHTISEIADKLYLTVSAVKWRLQSARDKLGVKHTTSAIRYLFESDDREQPKRE